MRFFSAILLLSVFRSFAQQEECMPSAEIAVTQDEIQLSSMKYQIKKDSRRNYVLFYPEGEKNSFWYRISVDSDCRFAFKITSADSLKSSKFFLYKNPDIGNFCDELKKKKIIPARSGDFFEEKTSGVTIISGKQKKEANFIQPVTALKGEVYYLNIRHKEESECGHYLSLIVSSEIVSFRATYPACFEEENKEKKTSVPVAALTVAEVKKDSMQVSRGVEIKPMASGETKKEVETAMSREEINQKKVTEIAVSPGEKSPVKRKITHVTVSGIVRDSITGAPLLAELKWTDEHTGKEIVAQTNPKGEYSMALNEKVIYKLTCGTVGYREKNAKFIRQNLNSEALTQDFFLSPLKPGDNFILKHIYFYAGTYAMKPESQPELEKLLAFMTSQAKVKIEIQGHTNGEGKVKKRKTTGKKKMEEGWDFHGNEKKLSKFRAEAIKNYLLKNGIAEGRVSADGMGATRMIYPEPANQRQKEANRRVEVYILPSAADLASVLKAISE